MEELMTLDIGDRVYFLNGSPKIYEVQAKLGKYIVATSKSKKSYTIIDVEAGICGPHDRVFNFYDFSDVSSMEDLLRDLVATDNDEDDNTGIKISYRNRVSINDRKFGLDIERTLARK